MRTYLGEDAPLGEGKSSRQVRVLVPLVTVDAHLDELVGEVVRAVQKVLPALVLHRVPVQQSRVQSARVPSARLPEDSPNAGLVVGVAFADGLALAVVALPGA